jgi:hypothetical protein
MTENDIVVASTRLPKSISRVDGLQKIRAKVGQDAFSGDSHG